MNLLITYYSLVTQMKSVYRVLFFVFVNDVLGIEPRTPCYLATAPVLLHKVLSLTSLPSFHYRGCSLTVATLKEIISAIHLEVQ